MSRDNPHRAEILDTYEREGQYFATIRLIRGDVDRIFEFGVSEPSYRALRRVFQMRPFDTMPGLKYRYFVGYPCGRSNDPLRCHGTIRFEQGNSTKGISVELPHDLIANLLWFYKMDSLEPASHLRSWPYDRTEAHR